MPYISKLQCLLGPTFSSRLHIVISLFFCRREVRGILIFLLDLIRFIIILGPLSPIWADLQINRQIAIIFVDMLSHTQASWLLCIIYVRGVLQRHSLRFSPFNALMSCGLSKDQPMLSRNSLWKYVKHLHLYRVITAFSTSYLFNYVVVNCDM